MSDSCCLIRPLESDSEFSLPKQRSKVVAHKPPRIQYCGGPGDAHPTHSSSQLATPLSQWKFQGTSSGTRSTPHPWTYRPRPPHPACFQRDSGHKWPATGDLTSKHPEFLTSQIRETVHQLGNGGTDLKSTHKLGCFEQTTSVLLKRHPKCDDCQPNIGI